MTTAEKTLAIRMDRTEALRALEGPRGRRSSRLEAALDRGLEALGGAMRPRSACRRVPLRHGSVRVFLEGGGPIESRVLGRVLSPCREAEVFVVTLGPAVDALIDRVGKASVHDGYVLDVLASQAASRAADAFRREVEASLPPWAGLTERYSPGNCDWPVTGQRMVFGLLDGEEAGVTLSAHCLMRPRKSVSGVIGVGPKDRVERSGDACRLCSRKDCDYRRRR